MRDLTPMSMSEPQTLADDLIWGAANIAAFIGRTKRQTDEALMKGELPARQVNGRWVASRSRLRAFFGGTDVGSAEAVSPAPEFPQADLTPIRAASKPSRRATATVFKLTPRKGRAA